MCRQVEPQWNDVNGRVTQNVSAMLSPVAAIRRVTGLMAMSMCGVGCSRVYRVAVMDVEGGAKAARAPRVGVRENRGGKGSGGQKQSIHSQYSVGQPYTLCPLSSLIRPLSIRPSGGVRCSSSLRAAARVVEAEELI